MLEKLNQVQDHDLNMDALERDKGNIPPELTAKVAELASLNEKLAELNVKHDNLRKKFNSNQLELDNLQEQRKKASDAAFSAATSKEASQYQNQALQFEGRIQELEEDTLPLMEKMEKLEADVEARQGEISKAEPELADLQAQEKSRLEVIEAQINELNIQREGLIQGIDKPLLQQYEQIRRSKRGIGVVAIIGQQCGGCRVRLPIHILQKVGKAKGLIRCPSCGRILYRHHDEV